MRYEDANYSRLEMSTEFFMIPVSVVHNSPVTEIEPTSSISVLRSPVPYQSSFFRREIWVPPLLVLSVLSMVLIVLFEVNLTSTTSAPYKFSYSPPSTIIADTICSVSHLAYSVHISGSGTGGPGGLLLLHRAPLWKPSGFNVIKNINVQKA